MHGYTEGNSLRKGMFYDESVCQQYLISVRWAAW